MSVQFYWDVLSSADMETLRVLVNEKLHTALAVAKLSVERIAHGSRPPVLRLLGITAVPDNVLRELLHTDLLKDQPSGKADLVSTPSLFAPNNVVMRAPSMPNMRMDKTMSDLRERRLAELKRDPMTCLTTMRVAYDGDGSIELKGVYAVSALEMSFTCTVTALSFASTVMIMHVGGRVYMALEDDAPGIGPIKKLQLDLMTVDELGDAVQMRGSDKLSLYVESTLRNVVKAALIWPRFIRIA